MRAREKRETRLQMQCFECGDDGHIARECPNKAQLDNGWCGDCDETTRQLDRGDSVKRCPRCHPARRQLPPQQHRCSRCQLVIYRWDIELPCDKHRVVSAYQSDDHAGIITYVGPRPSPPPPMPASSPTPSPSPTSSGDDELPV